MEPKNQNSSLPTRRMEVGSGKRSRGKPRQTQKRNGRSVSDAKIRNARKSSLPSVLQHVLVGRLLDATIGEADRRLPGARAGGVSDQNEGAMLSFADLSVDAPYGPDRTVLPRALQALLL